MSLELPFCDDISHFIYLDAIRVYIEKGGRSRGSYIVIDSSKKGDVFVHE